MRSGRAVGKDGLLRRAQGGRVEHERPALVRNLANLRSHPPTLPEP